MSKSNFTSSPWILEEDFIFDKVGFEIAHVARHGGEKNANARIIAAAPDMYEMLAKIRDLVGHMDLFDIDKDQPMNKTIDEILKRARGEE